MPHVRVIAPPDRDREVLELLHGEPTVRNVVSLGSVAQRPRGGLFQFDVDSDDIDLVVTALQDLGCGTRGSIAVHPVDMEVSEAATGAGGSVRAASDVAWEQVESRTLESTDMSASYLAYMVLAMLIAASGILQGTAILIVGAMIVGPDFGPVAGVCVAAVERRPAYAVRSLWALGGGFAAGWIVTVLVSLLLRAVSITPPTLVESSSQLTRPVAEVASAPNFFSFFVAFLAGIAGLLSLSSSKSGALVGVLVSVTTIPAAANAGLTVAYGQWSDALGSAEQLAANVGTLLVAGTATLIVQRIASARRRARQARSRETV